MLDKIQETESAVPANAIGSSSSVVGTGGIDTFDPLLKNTMFKRQPKKLSDIIGPSARIKELKKEKQNG
jgi:hypothetical protein